MHSNKTPHIMKRHTLTLLSALFITLSALGANTIHIGSQSDFNAMASALTKAVNAGAKDIVIDFAPGTYLFNENHLTLQNKQWASVNIAIKGNNATIVSSGQDYKNNHAYAGNYDVAHGFVSLHGSDMPLWGALMQADDLVEVMNLQSKVCRITCADIDTDLPANKCRNTYICVTQWFKSNIYKVNYIKDSDIYFTATDLVYNKSRDAYSINADHSFGNVAPRFRLCNMPDADPSLVTISNNRISLPNDTGSTHECLATRFLNIDNSSIGSLAIEQLNFLGNSNSNSKKALLQLTSSKMQSFSISHCNFKAIQSTIIKVDTTNNVTISDNSFSNCYREGILTACSANTTIKDNTFCDMGLALTNTFCIRATGNNLSIAHNTLRDFGYGGIAVGTWWGSTKDMANTGVVEHNLLYYTDDYAKQWRSHSLMDSGAIYLYTQLDNMQVRYNFINNINGAYLNRGIFCDDGALNFQIYSNIITNTANSFSIDSRRSLGIEADPKTKIHTVNINNRIYGNIVSEPIRFEGRNANANCHMGTNLLLGNAKDITKDNAIKNLQSQGSFLNITQWTVDDNRLIVPSQQASTLRKLPNYQQISQWIVSNSKDYYSKRFGPFGEGIMSSFGLFLTQSTDLRSHNVHTTPSAT